MTTYTKPKDRITSCGDVSCEFLVDPIPRPTPPPITVNTAPAKREIVLCDNHKPNSMEILRGAQKILCERGVPVRDEIKMKFNPSMPFPAADLEELAANGGLILCGVSDCGSCSSSSARDSILLQQRGAAGIAILTEPFESQVERICAYFETDRPIPVIVLDHPMQNLSADELRARSEALADAAEKLLAESTAK